MSTDKSTQQHCCRHCGRGYWNNGRQSRLGLCWGCYQIAEVRREYRGPPLWDGDFYGGYDLPGAVTTAAPGSAEKVEVLAARASARVSLWHPDDGMSSEE